MTNPQPSWPDEVAKRQLHFLWLVDWSGSMEGKKIAALNQAIREAMSDVEKALSNHPTVRVLVRCIRFADTAEWHIGPQAIELGQFVWPDLGVDGLTATAHAVNMLCSELDIEKMPNKAYPPVCILISDGFCTDSESEYDRAIAQLESLPWGKKAVRIAIAIGDETNYDEAQLLKFTNQKKIGVLKAHNAPELVQAIKWASTAASLGASAGKSGAGDGGGANVILPSPPPGPLASVHPGDVF